MSGEDRESVANQERDEAGEVLNAELVRHQTFVNSGAHGWHEALCRCGWSVEYGRRSEAQAHDLVRDHLNRTSVDAVWPLAAEAGYRRAVQALRDHDRFFGWLNTNPRSGFMAAPSSAADYLEALADLAAAPRNEGAQT